MRLELKDPNSALYVAPMPLYPRTTGDNSGRDREVTQGGSDCTFDKPVRLVLPHREEKRWNRQGSTGLPRSQALLKAQSGGRGDLLTIYDEMDQSAYFSCLDLVSGFLQLTIHEADRHLTAFRNAEGKLWEYVRCGFGFQTGTISFCQLRRRQHHGSEEEMSA